MNNNRPKEKLKKKSSQSTTRRGTSSKRRVVDKAEEENASIELIYRQPTELENAESDRTSRIASNCNHLTETSQAQEVLTNEHDWGKEEEANSSQSVKALLDQKKGKIDIVQELESSSNDGDDLLTE